MLLFSLFNLFLFAFLPPVFWLAYFLKKDIHPEAKRNIIFAFLGGGVITIPTFFIENFLLKIPLPFNGFLVLLITSFLFVGLVEELMKFSVFKFGVQNQPFLDEPVDYLIYMITIALGFAAFENIITFTHYNVEQELQASAIVSIIRFWGPNLLHSLCSGMLGFFIFISRLKKKKILFLLGLALASALHGIFNLLIINIDLKHFDSIYFLLGLLVISFLILVRMFSFSKKIQKI